jgi:RHS repeat-associated protein
LNRLTSESNPETGTTTYTYDNDTTCGMSYGDLVKRVDALNNVTCYKYDALHRQTAVTYPAGPYASSTASKTFIYDTTTFTCTGGANVAGRLAEAFTGPSTAKITDEAFCYSPRGETTEVYESTPHSGGYYQIPMTYWANGLIETFGPFLTDPELTYTPDGEGRIGAISDLGYSVPSITYATPSGQPTDNQPAQIMTSCVGSTCYPITYQYDPNTLRMTGYSAALNGGTVSGALTWNPNGSLQKLVVADAFNSADAQTCTYGADDLSRIASVNCLSGSTNVWNQNFTYDAFGNITKQVPTGGTGISWIPGYNASTNRYTLGGTSYDADGNVTNDTFNTYTWDAEGKLLSEEGYTFIYDAFGHEAEWLSNGTYELSYITIGNYKLSATGQTPFYAEYPYPGGSLTSEGGGLTAAQMADWLGTSRAIYSYSGGNWIKSIAHAPFGETYVGNAQNFTGQWSDADTTNTTYYFPERQYRSSQGRWLSPDPAGTSAVDPSNPQSWNRYAYVLNNPLGNVDPNGLWCVWEDGTHDDDPHNDGNATQDNCASQGGHWDPNDTITGILTDGQGNVTQMNTVWGTVTQENGLGTSFTLTDFDTSLKNYSLLPNGSSGPVITGASFDQAVILLGKIGIFPSQTDNKYNGTYFGHAPTDFHLRDTNPTCSSHVTLVKNSGQNGQPTTGWLHTDVSNPMGMWPSLPNGSGVGGSVPGQVVAWPLHGASDLIVPLAGMICGKG